MSNRKYDAAIFDMDGTILDTLEDLKDSCNYALERKGYPLRSLAEIKSFVGNGIGKLIERAVPEGTTKEDIKDTLDIFKDYYKDHSDIKTKPYDGIVEAVKQIRAAGIKTAVVSNKADFAVKDLCEGFFKDCFDYSLGEMEGRNRKPAPDMVWKAMSELGVEDKKKAVYIGDSDVDIMTARNSELDAIIVKWGFRDEPFLREMGAKVLVDKPEEILDLLGVK